MSRMSDEQIRQREADQSHTDQSPICDCGFVLSMADEVADAAEVALSWLVLKCGYCGHEKYPYDELVTEKLVILKDRLGLYRERRNQ